MKRLLFILTSALLILSCGKEPLQESKMQEIAGEYECTGILGGEEKAIYIPEEYLKMARPAVLEKTGQGTWQFSFTLFHMPDSSKPERITLHDMAMDILWSPVSCCYIARNVRSLSGSRTPDVNYVFIHDNIGYKITVHAPNATCTYKKTK
ncbi:MAG: hypothetical protein KBS67_07345 [Bacteroidales bacterium]|nr:hypothetical protein [Candidatus Cryptobacteroides equifaecalis]